MNKVAKSERAQRGNLRRRGLALGLLADRVIREAQMACGARCQPSAAQTRAVAIDLLPSFVKVFEKDRYSHLFHIPSDAMNAHLDGEFTVAGLTFWRDFFFSGRPKQQHRQW